MYKLESVPLTISGILKGGWEVYKASLKSVLLWSFILSIVHIIPYMFGFIGFYQKQPNGDLLFSWWGLLFFAAMLIVEAYFVTVLFYSMYSIITKQKVDYSETFSLAKNLLINLYIAMVIYFLLICIGFIIFILPAIFVAIIFSMFLPFMIIERTSIYPAFENSARLVWGHWWQTFFVFIIAYILGFALRSFGKIVPLGTDWLLFVDLVVLTFILPYFYAVVLVQYNNLKTIKSLPEPISPRNKTESP